MSRLHSQAHSIPDEVVSHIRHQASIIEVAHRLGMPVTRRGTAHLIVCPFHNDGSSDGGSCRLNPTAMGSRNRSSGEPNWFKCHGCGRIGSVFSFYALTQGLEPTGPGFIQSVIEVAEMFGLGDLVARSERSGSRAVIAVAEWLTSELRLPESSWKLRCPESNRTFEYQAWVLRQQESDPIPAGLLVPADDEDDLYTAPQPGLEYLALRDRPPTYPVIAVAVEPLDVIAVVELRTRVVRGLLFRRGQKQRAVRFGRNRNIPRHVPPLSDRGVPLLGQRLALESPFDWVRLAEAGHPVAWGCWLPDALALSEHGIDGPMRSAPTMTIPWVIALSSGTDHTAPERVHACHQVDQGWVLTQTRYDGGELAMLTPHELERVVKTVLGSGDPVVKAPVSRGAGSPQP